MDYTDNEVDLLQLTWKGSDDEYPPFCPTEIKWRGEVVPFVMGVEWKSGTGSPVITLTVTCRKQRGHAADKPAEQWCVERYR